MYCPNCGNHLEEGATFCPECGDSISKENRSNTNTFAILGFIFSIVSVPTFYFAAFSITGLILSILGVVKANREGLEQKGLAIAGIVISAITLLLFIGVAALILSAMSELGNWAHYYY